MIVFCSSAEESLAIDVRWVLQFMQPTLVAVGYQLRGLIRVASSNVERQIATFADVPYHDHLNRQQWEQLWRTEPQ